VVGGHGLSSQAEWTSTFAKTRKERGTLSLGGERNPGLLHGSRCTILNHSARKDSVGLYELFTEPRV
jgi:hypothetical protein